MTWLARNLSLHRRRYPESIYVPRTLLDYKIMASISTYGQR